MRVFSGEAHSRSGSSKPKLNRRSASLVSGLLAFGAVLGATQAIAPAARADYFGSTACGGSPENCVSLANNRYHVVNYYGTVGDDIPNLPDNMPWVLTNTYTNTTDLQAYRDPSDAYPDVLVHDNLYGTSSPIGWVVCSADNTGVGGDRNAGTRWCRGQHARFNGSYYWEYSGVFDTDYQTRSVLCHELGHTLGLRHRSTTNTCMHQTDPWTSGPVINSDERSHINAQY